MTEFQIFFFGFIFAIFNRMKNEYKLPFRKSVVLIPLFIIVVLWAVYWIEIQFSLNFTKHGLLPRKITGLQGVFYAPFIHKDTNHLFNNSIPLMVLLSSLLYFYKAVWKKVLIVGTILTGILTWVIAREAYHIGASGVVYLLFSFVFFSGIIKRQYQLVAVSLIIIFLYGGMVWYVFPLKEDISWEGHLSGFIIGLLFAVYYRNTGIVSKEYQFKETEFDLLFDDEGNFIPPPPPPPETVIDNETGAD